ncbi:50S ribosomal protein L33 [Lederbergia sp. NSJ-179]|nr:50S ribosomal protein L33 [Lederbergia sp. NSJ-179]MCJ7843370.1 50S ribosomal protein L33 [Lederbergia sp. NSJ-179]
MKQKRALACVNCGSRNYSTDKNTKTTVGRLELKKYCKNCQTHTIHKETK